MGDDVRRPRAHGAAPSGVNHPAAPVPEQGRFRASETSPRPERVIFFLMYAGAALVECAQLVQG
ncbi:hypothetical protein GCM10015535_69190 [Streptomyces gelaticus]|uniref:Uncharacterized protein n=1 Tax=Streptomyces gelaticus TaxID=285446 RepID=A0ABQ2WD22_9ACTN|nr:hypothetical protein GCM10015535_69190 [Streptomyces gelaticus]